MKQLEQFRDLCLTMAKGSGKKPWMGKAIVFDAELPYAVWEAVASEVVEKAGNAVPLAYDEQKQTFSTARTLKVFFPEGIIICFIRSTRFVMAERLEEGRLVPMFNSHLKIAS